MARCSVAFILLVLLAGAFAQPVTRRVSPSPSPAVAAADDEAPAASPKPAAAADAEASPAPSKLSPEAQTVIDDAIAKARPAVRGRDAAKVLDAMPEPLAKVAEAKATGVPVQIAVARAVTDVQKKAQLNPASRQAVLDAAYRVYTASPATPPKPSPIPSPEPSPALENATDAMNATMPEDMNMTAGGNETDVTLPADEAMDANATEPLDNTTSSADNATAAANATEATAAKAAPKKSSAAMGFVSTSLLAALAAAVAVLL